MSTFVKNARATIFAVRSSRWRLGANRWLETVLVAIIAAAIVVVLAPSVTRWIGAYVPFLHRDGTAFAVLAGAVAVVLLASRGAQVSVGRPGMTIVYYPPLWIAAALGLLIATFYWSFEPAALQSVLPGEETEKIAAILLRIVGWLSLGLMTTVVLASTRTLKLTGKFKTKSEPRPKATAAANSKSSTGMDSATLIRWLKDDLPIAIVDQDAFGHNAIARRIVRRLCGDGIHAYVPAMAIVGPLGAGKTSLRRLVETEVKVTVSAQNIRIVPFSAWPFDTTVALVAGILSSIVDTLEHEIGSPLLRSVPENYVSIIEGAVGNWSRLARAFDQTHKPEVVLRRVDEIATAVGLRIVLWVEDLERFGASELSAESDAVRERLAPVRALLHLLQETQSVTIVVAAPSLSLGLDLEKLARFIEVLRPPSGEQVLHMLNSFRATIFESLQDGSNIVDAARPDMRKLWSFLPERMDVLSRAFVSVGRSEETHLGPALLAICKTPRSIKQGLRECHEICTGYAGEIDFDHVLAASLLRHGQPAVFAAVAPLADRLRVSHQNDSRDSPWKALDALLASLVDDHRTRVAIRTIVFHLFSGSREGFPQGFARTEPVDYWRRYLALSELSPEECDQPILRAIDKMLLGDAKDLVVLTVDNGCSSKFEALAARLDPDSVIRLLDAQLNRLGDVCYSSWPNDDPPGIPSTWKLILSRARVGPWSNSVFAEILRRHILKNITSNLPLVEYLLLWFVSNDETTRGLLESADRAMLRASFVDAFVEKFRNAPEALVNVLSAGPEWLLARLCWGIDRIRKPDGSLPFDDWHEFVPTIMSSAVIDPGVMLPQIAFLITTRINVMATEGLQAKYEYDATAAKLLFGDESVLKLFRAAQIEAAMAASGNVSEVSARLQAVGAAAECEGDERSAAT